MALAYSISRILEILGDDCEVLGTFEGTIQGIASLSEATTGDLSFLGNPKYRSAVADSQASVVLVPKDYELFPSEGQLYLKLENPSFALALICRDIERTLLPAPAPGIHPTAVVESGAVIAPEASVGAFCYIGAEARVGAAVLASHVCLGRSAIVGDGAEIASRVSIGDYCVIGERNRLLPGCVIGSDGYGYEYLDGAHQRVPQIGNVVTAADVDVGANTTIDRARFGSTQIGQGTKIDNQVQIAHNVRIGRHCLIVAQVGISGSTTLGDGVVVGGQAGLAGHLNIGSGVMIAGGTAVVSDIEPQLKVRGYPAMPMMLFNRMTVLQRKLPDLFKRFDQLEKTVKSLPSESQ
ncbi:UDP-3-O-(3-hydroxymyristoyl)glucosamine N-acyltransferase [Coraliomargarita sp. SDUM461004]|uniref:UDP-3-O-acylglucosamine N-acyltransferase n=1 Tax=Thalassobacterium sedimentorum TaxID=3041258 RepID=A0ABU1AG71_9BACT|nr:UDP-3-O-(3-hydroxymyristoyl)glucosamine N-acyltransferase [Coraliomargarita sp. SDUM461004]MDQ8193724.1 UDP-3-O-(3-hydroxymyristoyl)glucosamine N-acyltransferase [Coraliomargarita sp. SDUM461004]